MYALHWLCTVTLDGHVVKRRRTRRKAPDISDGAAPTASISRNVACDMPNARKLYNLSNIIDEDWFFEPTLLITTKKLRRKHSSDDHH